MRPKQHASRAGESFLADSAVTAIDAERTRVEHALGHEICGRYLGDRNGNLDVCWKTREHAGTHL